MANRTIGLENVKILPPQEVQKIANEHLSVFSRRVGSEGIDADGKQLPEYSDWYTKLIVAGFRNKDGSRMKGYEQIALESSAQKLAKRNFRLRGFTMKNFRVRDYQADQYVLGWDGEAARIVDKNFERGRDIISTIPDNEKEFIADRIATSIDKELKRKLKDVKIVVGR